MTAILGRMATYSGKELEWKAAIEFQGGETPPEDLAGTRARPEPRCRRLYPRPSPA